MRFKSLLLLFILILIPGLALADVSVFNVPSSDKSLQYLGMIFGSVPGTPILAPGANTGGGGQGTAFFSNLVYIFNQVVFVLGILIIVYTTVVGAIHTAQEGEFLGKSWHSIMVPVRAGIGIFLLLPSMGGYNWIQITVMWFIIQGIGAANALWAEVIRTNETQGSIRVDTRQKILLEASTNDPNTMKATLNAIFLSDLCMWTVNNNPGLRAAAGEDIVSFRVGDAVYFGRLSKPQEAPLCGSVLLPSVGGDPTLIANNKNVFESTVGTVSQALMLSAQSAYNGEQQNANAFSDGANAIYATAQSVELPTTDLSQFAQDAINIGWIHAGSYYFQLVGGGGTYTFKPQPIDTTGPDLSPLGSAGTNAMLIMANQKDSYLNYAYSAIQSTTPAANNSGSLALEPFKSGSGQSNGMITQFLGNALDKATEGLEKQMTTGGAYNDPILSLADFGAGMAMTAEITLWVALVISFYLFLAASPMNCILPFAPTLNTMMTLIMPMLFMLIGFIWAPGIMLALYVPMIPYLVFTFTALGWVIFVIEAMFGSSLIALTFIVPSEDDIGRAGHALVILLGLFLRPALMILGFIMGINLLAVAIEMLNFGFFATLKSSTGGAANLGIFAMVAIIVLYAGLATMMVHEAMSLIYLLPNKVLRWMGASPEGEDAGQQVKGLKKSVESGTKTGEAGMKAGQKTAGKGKAMFAKRHG